jgi:hypothetical protein
MTLFADLDGVGEKLRACAQHITTIPVTDLPEVLDLVEGSLIACTLEVHRIRRELDS